MRKLTKAGRKHMTRLHHGDATNRDRAFLCVKGGHAMAREIPAGCAEYLRKRGMVVIVTKGREDEVRFDVCYLTEDGRRIAANIAAREAK